MWAGGRVVVGWVEDVGDDVLCWRVDGLESLKEVEGG